MEDLSPMQRKVYERLRDHFRRTGAMPELSDFARELGVHYVSLKQHLEALHRKDYLVFESRGRGRSPRLALPAVATGVPVLGGIPAGPLSEAIPDAEGYLPLTGLQDGTFALRVQGDSMADLIQNGDVVLFSKRQPQRSGEICAVRVEGSDVTLKYLDRLGAGRFALRAHNPAYPTLEVAAEDMLVDGVYRGLLRGELVDLLLERS
ncbi:MAG TPA: S24 family peptidase [Trueperaceae bacterium]|nr:S24 family peptidase [Trueperaceae bacterium]